ncbi:MAG: hypothetical protein PHC86_08425 [Eubacteriales bacterium]|nr:hypothetical protein [Eubacteriales bacterium]
MNNRTHEKQQLQQTRQTLARTRALRRRSIWQRRAGFGLNEVIGASVAVMIAALVVVPGMRNFSENILDKMSLWWEGMSGAIFAVA